MKRQGISPEERDAARRYLEHDYASEHLAGAAARAANEHAQELDEQHPRARDIALTGTSEELGELPKHLRAHQLHARKRAGISTEHASRIRSHYREGASGGLPARRDAGRSPARPPARRGARSSWQPRRLGRRASSAAATLSGGWSQTIWQMFAWGMGLSLLYLFLTRGAAAGKLFQGLGNAVSSLVAVGVDPLNPGAKASLPLVGAAHPTGLMDVPGGGTADFAPPLGNFDVAPGVTQPFRPPTHIPGLHIVNSTNVAPGSPIFLPGGGRLRIPQINIGGAL